METATMRQPSAAYPDVLRLVRALPAQDRKRLRQELVEAPRAHLVRSTATEADVERGRALAAQVRQELAASAIGTLDGAMGELRGRAWS